MKKALRVLCIALVALAAFAFASPALAASTSTTASNSGSISGQVVNKTPNGSAIGALQITLTQYDITTYTPGPTQTTTVDGTGKFQFNGLAIGSTITYTVGTTFLGANYTSVDVTPTTASPSQTIELDVYDVTSSSANVSVSSAHMIIYVSQGNLEVIEAWGFRNSGDTTYVGAGGSSGAATTLTFSLPAGATSVKSQTPNLTPTGGSLVYSGAVTAGANPTVISYDYIIPYAPQLTITRTIDYATSNFALIFQDVGVKVTSTALTKGTAPASVPSGFLYFSGSNLAKGSDVDVSVSGLTPTSGGTTGGSGVRSFPWPWIAAAALAVALAIVLLYPRFKRRPAAVAVEADEGAPLQTSAGELPAVDEKALLQEMANLDDAFETGALKEDEYRARRAQAKASLMQIYTRKKGGPGAA